MKICDFSFNIKKIKLDANYIFKKLNWIKKNISENLLLKFILIIIKENCTKFKKSRKIQMKNL